MAQLRIYELTPDTAPVADLELALDKSGAGAAVATTVTNLFDTDLKRIRVGLNTTGGNARGTSAVDLQLQRSVVTQVASGNYSGLLAGRDNTVSGADSFIGSGYGNTVAGAFSGVVGGYGNQAAGDWASVGGGKNNVASGDYAAIAGGAENPASGEEAFIPGGFGNVAAGLGSMALGFYASADKRGQIAQAPGRVTTTGDTQASQMVAYATTTDATPTELLLYAGERMTIATDSSWAFRALIDGMTQGAAKAGGYELSGLIKNAGGTTSLVGSILKTVLGEDDAAWDATAVADDANDALVIQVTGKAGDTVRWSAHIQITEKTYA